MCRIRAGHLKGISKSSLHLDLMENIVCDQQISRGRLKGTGALVVLRKICNCSSWTHFKISFVGYTPNPVVRSERAMTPHS